LSENTCGEEVMLQPIRFHCVGFRISSGLTFVMYIYIYLTVSIVNSDFKKNEFHEIFRKITIAFVWVPLRDLGLEMVHFPYSQIAKSNVPSEGLMKWSNIFKEHI
jgi:hypothetical protein